MSETPFAQARAALVDEADRLNREIEGMTRCRQIVLAKIEGMDLAASLHSPEPAADPAPAPERKPRRDLRVMVRDWLAAVGGGSGEEIARGLKIRPTQAKAAVDWLSKHGNIEFSPETGKWRAAPRLLQAAEKRDPACA